MHRQTDGAVGFNLIGRTLSQCAIGGSAGRASDHALSDPMTLATATSLELDRVGAPAFLSEAAQEIEQA